MAIRPFLRTNGDTLLAISLSVAFQLQVWLRIGLSGDEHAELAGPLGIAGVAVTGLVFMASLRVRATRPLVPLLLAYPVFAAMGPGGLDGVPALLLALMAAAYAGGATTRETASIVAALGVAGLIVASIVRDPDASTSVGDLSIPVLLIGGSWVTGLVLRIRHDQTTALQDRADALERDRAATQDAAVAAERGRIARELHDVVAHAISVIVVQARGARHRLADDREAAAEALVAIEETGVEALAEMRRLLDVLSDVDGHEDGTARAPRPGLRDLDRLVVQVRDAGLPVELTVEGEPRRLPPGVDVSAYRIVQEALTNVLRHAGPATARILVRYGDPVLHLEIADTGRGAGTADRPGKGLIGMRERAALVGGNVEAGPGDGGGYVVRANLPNAVVRP